VQIEVSISELFVTTHFFITEISLLCLKLSQRIRLVYGELISSRVAAYRSAYLQRTQASYTYS
jgi:hypothetical protein